MGEVKATANHHTNGPKKNVKIRLNSSSQWLAASSTRWALTSKTGVKVKTGVKEKTGARNPNGKERETTSSAVPSSSQTLMLFSNANLAALSSTIFKSRTTPTGA